MLGPLLFSLYTRAVPEVVDVTCQLFADDILLYCHSTETQEVASRLSTAVSTLSSWLELRGLHVNADKTKAMFVSPPGHQVPDDIIITCNTRQLDRVSTYKYLGLVIDDQLNWMAHIDLLAKKVSQKIGALRRAGHSLSAATRRQYYLSIVQADLEYGSNALSTSLSARARERITRLSKRGVRAIIGAPPWHPSAPLYSSYNICPILKRYEQKLIVSTYRCTHSLASSLLCSQIQIRTAANSTVSTTRSQTSLSLVIPNVIRRSGMISPVYNSTLLWNNLPSSLRNLPSLSIFRNKLFAYLGHPVMRP